MSANKGVSISLRFMLINSSQQQEMKPNNPLYSTFLKDVAQAHSELSILALRYLLNKFPTRFLESYICFITLVLSQWAHLA